MTSTFDDLITMIKEKQDPYSFIASFIPAIYWLNQLYIELGNQVRPLKDLEEETKKMYWNKTNRRHPKWLRILACRAMVAFKTIEK